MRTRGVHAVSLTVAYDPDDTISAINAIAGWRALVAHAPDRFRLLLSPDDPVRAQSDGTLAVGFHFQGTTPFARNTDLVGVFHALGVRHALLAYNQRNHVGDGVHEASDGGLSRFGRELVDEMQRVGITVDCSHTGERTARDAFEMATRPMVYSHANAHAVYAHDRNISDDLARACTATGGVVGVNGIGIFLGDNEATAERLFRHTDHWVQTLGPQHVGLGLDIVTDMNATRAAIAADPTKWPADQDYAITDMQACGPEVIAELTELMASTGYDDASISNILGGNWVRIARETWTPDAQAPKGSVP